MILATIKEYIFQCARRGEEVRDIRIALNERFLGKLLSEVVISRPSLPLSVNINGVSVTFYKESRKTAETNDILFNQIANFHGIR